MPGASKFTIQILRAVAENERNMTSERTNAAPAIAKANGKRLGSPDSLANIATAVHTRSLAAEEFRSGILDEVREMLENGATLQQIANHLNHKRVPTPCGKGVWCPKKVSNGL